MLDGAINIVAEHGAGDYVYLPPRTVRVDTVGPGGALVVAYFSAAPEWVDGVPQMPTAHKTPCIGAPKESCATMPLKHQGDATL